MSTISLKFMIEKIEGYGEDSPPLSIVNKDLYAVGVFDGMGGSGAAICKSEYGDNHTKAYVASRIIKDAVSAYIENVISVNDISSDGIKSIIKGRLEQEKATFKSKASGLRSKLVRDYPTTLAIIIAIKNEDNIHTINSYWAGDSRNYLWTSEGFYQISKDDLDEEFDPLENLSNDGVLSNCVCADRDFSINSKEIKIRGKFIILSATDGCFNYFLTPMHFNEVLLTGLKLSETLDEWENFCKAEISTVTGDDMSLSLIAVGFNDFSELKQFFIKSEVKGVKKIEIAQTKINTLSKDLDDAKIALESIIKLEWNEYKNSYMKYFDSVDTLIQYDKSEEFKHKSGQIALEYFNSESDSFKRIIVEIKNCLQRFLELVKSNKK